MHISIRQLIMIAMGILPRSVEYRAQNKHCLDTHNQVLGKWYVSSSEAVSNLSSFCLFVILVYREQAWCCVEADWTLMLRQLC